MAHNIKILFLPPYSSPLNPIEHVWAAFKTLWRNRMARTMSKVPQENLEQLVNKVMDEVQTTPKLLDCITSAIKRVLNNELV